MLGALGAIGCLPPSPPVNSIRGATGLVFFYNPVYRFTNPDVPHTYYGLRGVAAKLTPMGYAPPNQMTTHLGADGRFRYDHSAAGIEAGARKLAARAKAVHDQHGARSLWIDIEEFSSVNVPASVGYVEAVDGYHANTYVLSRRSALKREVIRFRSQLVSRARSIVHHDYNLSFFEFADYNFPNKLNLNERFWTSTHPNVMEEVLLGADYLALLDACGPQAQFIVDANTISKLPPNYIGANQTAWDNMIEWFVNGARIRAQAHGSSYRPACAVWPVLFRAGGTVTRWPTSTQIVPAGVMTRLLNELKAAGVRRFWLWPATSTLDWSSQATRDEWNARWQEVAAWIQQQPNVQTIT
jgi:hypothetical protein